MTAALSSPTRASGRRRSAACSLPIISPRSRDTSTTGAPFPRCPRQARSLSQLNGDTVTLSVVDRDGGACSLINSIYQTFGSGILAEGSGVLLQNRGLCFAFEPGHPNSFAPNTRPAHTIMPGMATRDGKPAISFGVMGEHYQPMGQTWVLTNASNTAWTSRRRSISRASARIWERSRSNAAFRRRCARSSSALGHKLREVERPLGGGQAIMIDHDRGVLIGGSDPRKDGAALGY